ncbi:hypothetical protein KAFR_0I01320 [Kazachstania africana CBS 2517]|uniref:Uncharacterized protein n=1 Tax=Kazachstania africana (strain ATCC 22294 / BCRC 22015 / CBS 2517 / CECT 1963 / NBRC 1671 / NRRL Y-8276) TaxID=1071382 RepID=H2AZW3_KAZAF|nr:hypothetical protein KAFR_0I01320 [Kazachstania africana CBS 2517]CCF59913.1 hypothetical protein KAFR_0I01320 [Kazachstania africana CBS 2517]
MLISEMNGKQSCQNIDIYIYISRIGLNCVQDNNTYNRFQDSIQIIMSSKLFYNKLSVALPKSFGPIVTTKKCYGRVAKFNSILINKYQETDIDKTKSKPVIVVSSDNDDIETVGNHIRK